MHATVYNKKCVFIYSDLKRLAMYACLSALPPQRRRNRAKQTSVLTGTPFFLLPGMYGS